MPLDPKLNKFSTASQVLVNYDSVDVLADGTGIITFNAVATQTSSGVDYILTREEIYSSSIETKHSGVSGGINIDFDLTAFNTPRTIRGTALVNVTLAVETGSGGGAQVGAVTATIKNGSTVIASATSQTLTSGTGFLDSTKAILNIPITIPETLFAEGDFLRLSITTADGGTDFRHYVGHDPKNRDGVGIIPSTDDPVTTTVLKLHMPFKLDL